MAATDKILVTTVDSVMGGGAVTAYTITSSGVAILDDADAAAQRATLGLSSVSNTADADKPISTATQTALDAKQATLVSATNIKTINGSSVLGSGDLSVSGSAAWGSVTGTLSNQSDLQTALDAKAGGTGTASGTNTGDQTITLTGDVTGSGTGSFAATIANAAVTLAKQANMATASVLYRKTAGSGAPEVQTLATLKTDLGLTGTNSGDQTTVTGNAGTATTLQTARAINGVNFDGSAAITVTANFAATGGGYTSGAGGTITQLTSKSTGVTLNKACGTITMNGAALASAAIVTFTVTNNTVAATDVVHVQHDTVGTIGGYTVMPNTSASGSFKISLRNNTAGSLSEAIVLRFAVIKAVTA